MIAPTDDAIPTEEAFEALGHETRLAILHALWEEQELDVPGNFPGPPISFTALRKRVEMRDPSQFNYHLKKLVGPFVHATEDGYALRWAGQQIVTAIRAGTLTEEVVLDEVAITDPCPLCGEEVVLEHGTERVLDWHLSRCTSCEGGWRVPDFPPGILVLVRPLEPAGIRERTPDEMYRAQLAWVAHEFTLMTEGVCPSCSGPVNASPLICEEHAVEPGRVCEACETIFKVRFHNVCQVCNRAFYSASDRHFVTHPTVHAFYHDHGYDPFSHDWLRIQAETIDNQSVVGTDPMEIRTEIRIDDERLVVTLDESGDIVTVEG